MFGRTFKCLRNHNSLFSLAMLAILTVSAMPAAAQPELSAKGLQGTWRVQVNVINCSTGSAIGPTFDSLLTFARGGTLTGTTRNPAFQAGQRSGDFGMWQRTGQYRYTADSEAFILFTNSTPPVFQSGTQRITQSIELDGDRFESVAITRFYDTHGNLLNSGCAHAIATRYQ